MCPEQQNAERGERGKRTLQKWATACAFRLGQPSAPIFSRFLGSITIFFSVEENGFFSSPSFSPLLLPLCPPPPAPPFRLFHLVALIHSRYEMSARTEFLNGSHVLLNSDEEGPWNSPCKNLLLLDAKTRLIKILFYPVREDILGRCRSSWSTGEGGVWSVTGRAACSEGGEPASSADRTEDEWCAFSGNDGSVRLFARIFCCTSFGWCCCWSWIRVFSLQWRSEEYASRALMLLVSATVCVFESRASVNTTHTSVKPTLIAHR